MCIFSVNANAILMLLSVCWNNRHEFATLASSTALVQHASIVSIASQSTACCPTTIHSLSIKEIRCQFTRHAEDTQRERDSLLYNSMNLCDLILTRLTRSYHFFVSIELLLPLCCPSGRQDVGDALGGQAAPERSGPQDGQRQTAGKELKYNLRGCHL